MKFCMNGALTIGTLDGANIEIREEVGAENFFLFGLSAPEVYALKAQGLSADGLLRAAIRTARGHRPDPQRFLLARRSRNCSRPLIDGLLYHDPYLVLADFQSYIDCQTTGYRGLPRHASAGRACRSSIPRAAASSHRIAPSANTARRSGASNPCRFICSHMRKQETHSARSGSAAPHSS